MATNIIICEGDFH